MEEKNFKGYRVSEDGKIFGKKNKLTTLKPYMSHGKLALKIDRETHYLHRIVAEVFKLKGFKKDDKSQIVTFKDGDSFNCALDNLEVRELVEHINDLNVTKSCELGGGYKTSIYPYVYKRGDKYVASYKGKYLGTHLNEDDAYYAVEKHKSNEATLMDVPGFDGVYKVNQYGEVYSVRFKKYLKTSAFDGSISLTKKDGTRTKKSIGLITYNAFNRKNQVKKVIHIDTDIMNNFLSNLKPLRK